VSARSSAGMAVTFRRAAQILQARGHAKGRFLDSRGCVCAMGALLIATGIDPTTLPDDGIVDDFPAAVFLSDRLWVAIDDDPVERIAEWNDKAERTQAEVVAALLSAAREIEARDRAAVKPTSVLLGREAVAA
jgi:hypothetical protein